MTIEQIEKEAQKYAPVYRALFIAGAKFVLRTQLEKKRQDYIDRIGYEPENKNIEDWNLQINLITKKINEL